MNDRDDRIASVLDRLVPPDERVSYDWGRVVADAGVGVNARPRRRWSRRRYALCALIAAVILAIPVIAFATGNGWWFQRQPYGGETGVVVPSNGAPAIVTTGQWEGKRWTMLAFVAPTPTTGPQLYAPGSRFICTTVIIGSLRNDPDGIGCSFLHGMAGIPKRDRAGDWLMYSSGSGPPIITGAAARGVARVQVVLNADSAGDVHTITLRLTTVPTIGGGIRFFAFRDPGVGVSRFVALDRNGKVLSQVPR